MLVIDDRTKLVARKVTDFLKESGDRFQKTIVFCVDEEHAARMRQALMNENADLVAENQPLRHADHRQRHRGAGRTGQFHRPGIEVSRARHHLAPALHGRRCPDLPADRARPAVGSMTEFKQIVGRGTRVHEDTKKYYFTIIDFRGATSQFADPKFDGEPVQIYEPGEDDPIAPPDDVPPARRRRGAHLRAEPGEDEMIVDGEPPDIDHPARRCPENAQSLRRWRFRRDHRRAGRVS